VELKHRGKGRLSGRRCSLFIHCRILARRRCTVKLYCALLKEISLLCVGYKRYQLGKHLPYRNSWLQRLRFLIRCICKKNKLKRAVFIYKEVIERMAKVEHCVLGLVVPKSSVLIYRRRDL